MAGKTLDFFRAIAQHLAVDVGIVLAQTARRRANVRRCVGHTPQNTWVIMRTRIGMREGCKETTRLQVRVSISSSSRQDRTGRHPMGLEALRDVSRGILLRPC